MKLMKFVVELNVFKINLFFGWGRVENLLLKCIIVDERVIRVSVLLLSSCFFTAHFFPLQFPLLFRILFLSPNSLHGLLIFPKRLYFFQNV